MYPLQIFFDLRYDTILWIVDTVDLLLHLLARPSDEAATALAVAAGREPVVHAVAVVPVAAVRAAERAEGEAEELALGLGRGAVAVVEVAAAALKR